MNALCYSPDGYIRLWQGILERLPLKHLHSAVDATLSKSATPASGVSGYTEWVSDGKPAISVGWDWRAAGGVQTPQFVRSGLPRSNLMLLDAQGQDVGPAMTSLMLAHWLDTRAALVMGRPWQAAVAQTCHLG